MSPEPTIHFLSSDRNALDVRLVKRVPGRRGDRFPYLTRRPAVDLAAKFQIELTRQCVVRRRYLGEMRGGLSPPNPTVPRGR